MKYVKFNPDLAAKKLFNSLDERPKIVLVQRFGLGQDSPRTLESIGQEYGITRERVRQIESFALNKVRKSEEFSQIQPVFDELKSRIEEAGGLVQEDAFLCSCAKQDNHKRAVLFLLVAGDDFYKLKEDDHFHHSWTTDPGRAEAIREALVNLHNEIDQETLLSEKEILSSFNKHLNFVLKEKLAEEILLSLLNTSRRAAPNSLGEWGDASSPFVRPRGMRDYAFLIMRKHGSPMHFSETAKAIEEAFSRPAHVQTVHNELIKDPRFVLVGRGLYALKDWGYEGGVVKNVIEKILSKEGPLAKEDIVKKVLKERYVKENTILVNLQNKNYFKKDARGNYALI